MGLFFGCFSESYTFLVMYYFNHVLAKFPFEVEDALGLTLKRMMNLSMILHSLVLLWLHLIMFIFLSLLQFGNISAG